MAGVKTILKGAGAAGLTLAAILGIASTAKDFKKSKDADDTKDADSDEDGMRPVEDALNNKSND